MRITLFEHVALDGVKQAPSRADEDRRNGFEHGGWATLWDPVLGSVPEGCGDRDLSRGAVR